MSTITIKQVTKAFGDVVVLKEFNEVFQDKEFITLLGPSGCGKTTMLRMIAGFERPTQGEIAIGEQVVSSKKVFIPPEKRDIGMVFQSYAVWPHMTVFDNVAYPLRIKKLPKGEVEHRVEALLQVVHLGRYAQRMPGQLSGGQQQRVAIARALVGNGDIIVMDEPITNLDAKLREQMLEEIREIQRKSGTTVLYITHDQQSALQLCDRMAIMEPDGSLCQLGTDEDIILHPANRFTFEFIGVSNFIPVEVAGSAITLRPGQKDFPWADGKLPEGTDTSKKLELGVRPNDIVFDKDSSLRVTVKRSVFLGSEYDYFVELGGRELRIQQNTLDAAKYGVMREGQETGIRLLNYRFYPEKEVSA